MTSSSSWTAQRVVRHRRSSLQRASVGAGQQFGLTAWTTVFLLAWWLFQQGQQLVAAFGPGGSITVDNFADATESGSLSNSLTILAFGLVGLISLRGSFRLLWAPRIRPISVLTCAYLGWAFVSLVWSVDPGLSFRRWSQLCLLVVGSVGLGLGFYGRSAAGYRGFATHLAVAGAIAVAVAWAVVASTGDVDVLDPAWGGAKSLGVGTNVIYPIALACLALVWMSRSYVPVWLSLGCVLVCLLSLALIKARSIAVYTALLAALLPLLGERLTSRRVTPYVVVLGCAAFAVGLVAAFGGQAAIDSITGQLWNYATLDTGGSDVQTLTGRTPLWTELLRYAGDRPWAGYGFGAFWNPDFMPAIASVVGWNAPSAHNGILDELLATGIIGLALFMGLWLAGLAQALSLQVARKDAFATFITVTLLFFLLCNLSDSVMQNYTRFVFYAALTGLFTLLGRHALQDEDEVRSQPAPRHTRYGLVGIPTAARARSRSASDR